MISRIIKVEVRVISRSGRLDNPYRDLDYSGYSGTSILRSLWGPAKFVR